MENNKICKSNVHISKTWPSKSEKSFLLFLFIIVLFLSGCETDRSTWNAANRINTIESYERYLEKYADGKYAKEAVDAIDEIVWHKAENENTIESYQKYLKKYSEGRYVKEAKENAFCLLAMTSYRERTTEEIDEYYKELAKFSPDSIKDAVLMLASGLSEISGLTFKNGKLEVKRPEEVNQSTERIWRYTDSLCGHRVGVYLGSPMTRLIVTQTYTRGADEVTLPFYEITEKILNYAGFSVVEKDATNYHATLSVKANGIPGSASYWGSLGGTHWTKATVKGVITFSAEARTFRWNFAYTEGPIQTIRGDFPTPNDAPFKSAFDEGFLPVLLQSIMELRGLSTFVIGALKERDSSLRWKLIEFLEEHNPDWQKTRGAINTIGEFIAAIKDEDPEIQKRVIWAFGATSDARAVESLIAALKDEDAGVRQSAARALGKIGGARAVEPLIAVLKDGNSNVRRNAAEALEKIGEAAVEPLIAALKDEDSFVRRNAAGALGEIGDARAVEPLIAVLKDGNSNVRRNAAEALEKIGEAAVEPLIAALKDEHSRVRNTAAQALGEIGDARAVESLVAALKDEHWRVLRENAAEALGEIGDARAVEPLIAALKDGSRNVQKNAGTALREIGEAAVEPLIAALKDENSLVRRNAAGALGEIGDARAVESLVAALKDEHWRVRENIAGALGEIGDTRAVEPLIAALKDEDSNVRRNAAEALKKITKQDFGEDQTKWKQWWDENKEQIKIDR